MNESTALDKQYIHQVLFNVGTMYMHNYKNGSNYK